MRYLIMLWVALLCANVLAADYDREKKWADEVLPSVLVGDPVWIGQTNGHRFLGLYAPVASARVGLVVVHGIGVHPDWGMISALRQQLPDSGYATLSIQMPVLKADAKSEDYGPTFDEAAERVRLAVDYLHAHGYAKVAVVSHSLGSRMSHHALAGKARVPADAWVAIGAPAPLDMSGLKMPVLDLYGQNDLPAVLKGASKRAAGLKQAGSTQVVVAGADHFFEGKDDALIEAVRSWLDARFK